MRFIALPCLAVALILGAPMRVARAADAEDALPPWAAGLTKTPELADRVVQRRKYDLDHEISLMAGALPSDPFFKGISGTLSYTLHINAFLAWEVVSATYVYDLDTNLKKALIGVALANGTAIPQLPSVGGYAASHLAIKPVYGKQAWRDDLLLHLELSLLLGPAGVMVSTFNNTTYTAGGDWDLVFRVWLNDIVSVRAQIGQLIYLFQGGFHEELHAEAGFSFNLGGEE